MMTSSQPRRRLERLTRHLGARPVGGVVRAAIDASTGEDLTEMFALELPTTSWLEMKGEIKRHLPVTFFLDTAVLLFAAAPPAARTMSRDAEAGALGSAPGGHLR